MKWNSLQCDHFSHVKHVVSDDWRLVNVIQIPKQLLFFLRLPLLRFQNLGSVSWSKKKNKKV